MAEKLKELIPKILMVKVHGAVLDISEQYENYCSKCKLLKNKTEQERVEFLKKFAPERIAVTKRKRKIIVSRSALFRWFEMAKEKSIRNMN